MSAKHTPANWVLDGAIVRSDSRPICEIYRELTSSPETLANAALIAAAPKMLAALQKLDADWSSCFPEGPDGNRVRGFGQLADETIDIWKAVRRAIEAATAA